MPDLQDTLKELLISSIEGAGKSSNGSGSHSGDGSSSGGSHGSKGLIAGVGAAALAPVAIKGLGRLAREAGMNGVQDVIKSPGKAAQGLTMNAGGQAASHLGDKVKDKVDEAGGPSGILSDTLKDALPFGGGGGSKGGGLGVGKGRRMPVQQSIDIAAPIETVYNQWTQFEDWPSFMHRVVRASQEDDNTVTLVAKIWTRSREFKASIETQRPNDRIKWKVDEGITHAGLVSFHELGPNLTRVLLSIDVQPGGMIEKMARGMRHVKRAVRGDLHRFKAFIEMAGQETGAWRGVIEDGEVVEEHDPSYDQDREYSDPEDILEQDESESDEDSDDADSGDHQGDDEDQDGDDDEQPRSRRRRAPSANGSSASSGGSRSSAAASRSSASRSAGSSSRSSGSSSRSSGSASRSSGSSSRSSGSSKPKSASKSGAAKSGGARTRKSPSGGSSSSSRRPSSGASSSGRSRSRGTSK